MERVDNPEMARKIINHLAEQYNILDKREPNHLSSYIGCLTKTYFDSKPKAVLPTEQEVLLFLLGYGLQDTLTPADTTTPVLEKEGIIYRPDIVFPLMGNRLVEVKTTRRSAKHHFTEDAIPETWLVYMKGGCYICDKVVYDLAILYMMGNYAPPFPQLYYDTFYFTDEEIADNWTYILQRKATLDSAIENNTPPTPFEHCYLWECQHCRYNLVCKTLTGTLFDREEKTENGRDE